MSESHTKVKVSEFFGENVFDFRKMEGIPENIRKKIIDVTESKKVLPKEHAEIVATAVTEWATSKGATHFCHWFQPLTGNTAEKHDAFLALSKEGLPIEKLSASQLLQGEPDASSFPHGGSRSTFEARGYTTWDLSSPLFLMEGENGKILCIPTAFVSYNGDALDVKTPLLRSISKISQASTKFLNLVGNKKTKKVTVTCGAEQEYFLVDEAFYNARPDLLMTGKTLFGSLSSKTQQLSDHYFGEVPDRILSFMQELDHELYRLGIPSKTRHNEVAPAQFEVAPIFTDANLSADHNQLIMALIKKISKKHGLVALLHEKPFADINGSGKHLNWSLCDDHGKNLLSPGKDPHQNHRFLALVSIIVEALYRHADVLRMSVSSHGNDHRLGGHEAPPSIISVFLGQTLTSVFKSIIENKSFEQCDEKVLDMGADQLAQIFADNTDRNRTSPFAFTGNRFEFRAVGSSHAIGFPLSILNAAVTEVLEESNSFIERELQKGLSIEEILISLIRKWMSNSINVIFDGDGYGEEWLEEAAKRKLPNLKNTAEAIKVLKDDKATSFLKSTGVYRKNEIDARFNVFLEKYNQHQEIEFNTFVSMVNQYVIPAGISYKQQISTILKNQKELGLESNCEKELYNTLSSAMDSLYLHNQSLADMMQRLQSKNEEDKSDIIAKELIPLSKNIASLCHKIEDILPDNLWNLPKYSEMLFLH